MERDGPDGGVMSGCSESFGVGAEPGCSGADLANKRAQLLGDEGYCVDGSGCCDRSPPRVTAEALEAFRGFCRASKRERPARTIACERLGSDKRAALWGPGGP